MSLKCLMCIIVSVIVLWFLKQKLTIITYIVSLSYMSIYIYINDFVCETKSIWV